MLWNCRPQWLPNSETFSQRESPVSSGAHWLWFVTYNDLTVVFPCSCKLGFFCSSFLFMLFLSFTSYPLLLFKKKCGSICFKVEWVFKPFNYLIISFFSLLLMKFILRIIDFVLHVIFYFSLKSPWNSCSILHTYIWFTVLDVVLHSSSTMGKQQTTYWLYSRTCTLVIRPKNYNGFLNKVKGFKY